MFYPIFIFTIIFFNVTFKNIYSKNVNVTDAERVEKVIILCFLLLKVHLVH
ncbi:hypothetical protein IV36_GL001307 [Liquorilactobacillus mali]|uniref:Uncharacterized protein n=1 Tax=Liquorilactobacillus mali TaxID=1618 RepID=A0A0R2FUY2_9LACO|nr:hypothetical protein IV36_GL001307 [Liquorilactobacillus mali]